MFNRCCALILAAELFGSVWVRAGGVGETLWPSGSVRVRAGGVGETLWPFVFVFLRFFFDGSRRRIFRRT